MIPEEEVEEGKTELGSEEVVVGQPISFDPQVAPTKTELRFAEDILGPKTSQPDGKAKKKKKSQGKVKEEEAVRERKTRRQEFVVEDEEEY